MVCSRTRSLPNRLVPLTPPAPLGLRGVCVVRRACFADTLHPASADYDVGDHRKMIGNTAGAMVDEARAHCSGRPAEDAVEVKKRTPRRKCRMPGPARKLPRERPPQRSRPEPFVEVAKH